MKERQIGSRRKQRTLIAAIPRNKKRIGEIEESPEPKEEKPSKEPRVWANEMRPPVGDMQAGHCQAKLSAAEQRTCRGRTEAAEGKKQRISDDWRSRECRRKAS